ncbi:hypothetical protein K450DRAFT_224624 [Umbelopsis ramanniana AG]|uniref:Alpha-galactosidase n=1 Tax=Umbelopsis ramanniana AG TaxID=1314678 RepID=A0AAD5HI08_UMBRA|nr:uncharacterized protein K450DRAFT_224624 [Umbelopsis ramanniana AG]KAI8583186.1 hypothetical protein K450DRAFT_224624 [Umbelopsis ramanniana AG]
MLPILYLPLLFPLQVAALMDGLSSTPPMGWNTWNKYGCNIEARLIRETADIMVSKGFLDAGYRYLNLDDCWQSNDRDYDGNIIVDRYAFPEGIKAVADYVHSKGLYFGIYSSAGYQTCAGRMASLGHEESDAINYANWSVDYLKYDNCNFRDGISGKERYKRMGDALKATGRNITFSICNWGSENPWEWADEIGHAFRTHDDIIASWESVLEILDVHAQVVQYGGPGHWADPGMLEVGNGALNIEESRTHFSLWAAMKAPLILGNDLTHMSDMIYDILTNRKVISVNQDSLGVPARRVVHVAGNLDIWTGPLSGGSVVVVIVNYGESERQIPFTDAIVDYYGEKIQVEDLWTGKTSQMKEGMMLSSPIPPHGCTMLKLTNGTSIPYSDSLTSNASKNHYPPEIMQNDIDTSKLEDVEQTLYEAEALVNVVSGLTLRYMDCLSWSLCGDYWTRRWGLRLRINDGEETYVYLRKIGDLKAVKEFSMGLYLDRDINSITLDNPEANGPSMDSIILKKHPNSNFNTSKGAVWTTGFSSEDPLAGDHWILYTLRCIVDYMLDAAIFACGISTFGFVIYLLYGYFSRLYRHVYQPVGDTDIGEYTLQNVSETNTSIA